MVDRESTTPSHGPGKSDTTVTVTQPIRVLYVADDRTTGDFVERRLTDRDSIDLWTTTSEDELIDRLAWAETPADCVLVGHDPPELDAVELADRLREYDCPVVVVTANGDEHLASRSIAKGAGGYVPIRLDTGGAGVDPLDSLLEQIHESVRQHQFHSGLELYRSLTEDAVAAADVGLLIRNTSDTVVWLNRSVERYLGLSGHRLIDRPFREIVVEELDSVLEAPDEFVREIDGTAPAGSVDCHVLPGADRDERVLEYHERSIASGAFAGGRVGLFYDVTDRRERERELERYETMVETVADGVYTLDAEYNYTFVNEAMTELTGYSREDLIGMHASKLIDEATNEAAYERRAELMENPDQVMTAEYEMYTADGEAVPIEVRFRPLPFDEEFRGTTGVIRDISDRKTRERKLRRQNERLDSFASVVSHDLREPLRTVRNYLGLLERRHADELDGDAEEFVEFAVDGAERMQWLIDDVLELARKGRVVGDRTAVDLTSAARTAWSNVDTRDATLRVEEGLGTVRADESRFLEVLQNLFDNAVEHGGPQVTVQIGRTETGFFVADDGPGIDPEKHDDVFEYRHTTDPESTGLGLAIADEIADAHDWSLTVTESASGGARFEITTDDR